MRIIDLETINQAMDNETQFVLRCEEVFHYEQDHYHQP